MPCRPARFREGDIVTCTFALALVPRKGKGNGYTMIKVLRQLALEHEMPIQVGHETYKRATASSHLLYHRMASPATSSMARRLDRL